MKSKKCTWKYDESMSSWETTCRNAFCIEEGTPKENDMRFCCCCGKELVEKYRKGDF